MQSFVDDLLDLRQIKENAFALRMQPFDVNEILELVCNIFNPQA